MKDVMKSIVILICIVLANAFSADAQTEKVSQMLRLIAQGKSDEVRPQLNRLIADYPDEPGVKLLQGVLMEDGVRANTVYRSIVLNYPNSEWADDAQWRIVQFYAIIGDTLTAKKELEFFRKKYPKSEFLAPASDVVSSSIGSLKYNFKEKIEHNAKEAEAKKINKDSKTERYGLQVGVYSTKSAAEAEKSRFLGMKLKTNIIEKEIDGRTKYAVVIGDYSTFESAESAKKEVEKKCSCTPMVYKKTE